jgi:anti-anti-sigma regulatory factor
MSMLRITEQRCADVVVLTLHGTLSPDSAVAFSGSLANVLLRGYRKVLVGLDRTRSSGAAGVGAFLEALLEARARGAELKLVNLARPVTDVVVAAAFYFSVFDTEEDALDSFGFEPPVDGRQRGSAETGQPRRQPILRTQTVSSWRSRWSPGGSS